MRAAIFYFHSSLFGKDRAGWHLYAAGREIRVAIAAVKMAGLAASHRHEAWMQSSIIRVRQVLLGRTWAV